MIPGDYFGSRQDALISRLLSLQIGCTSAAEIPAIQTVPRKQVG